MVETLVAKSCTPCKGGIPPLTEGEAQTFHAQVAKWELSDEARRIERTFRFKNFGEALASCRRLGSSRRLKGITPTSASDGATPRWRCRRRRSKACTRTISSWPPRLIGSWIKRRPDRRGRTP